MAVGRAERFNGVSHLLGAGFAFVGLLALVSRTAVHGDAWTVVACSVYGTTLLLLYACSSLYHLLEGRAKDVFRRLDHGAIYLLIAGSYTPFMLVTLRGEGGLAFLGVVSALALAGIVHEFVPTRRPTAVAVSLYLGMGWLAMLMVVPLARALPAPGVALLFAGGLFYTLGVPFYALDRRLPWGHGAFHLFVLAGSAAHFAVVFRYVAAG